MAGQLTLPVELAPPIPDDLSSEQRIALWREAYDAGERLLLAGLARDVGPGGDVRERRVRSTGYPIRVTMPEFVRLRGRPSS